MQHNKANNYLRVSDVRLLACETFQPERGLFLSSDVSTGQPPSVHRVTHLPNVVQYYLLTGGSGGLPAIVGGLYFMIKTGWWVKQSKSLGYISLCNTSWSYIYIFSLRVKWPFAHLLVLIKRWKGSSGILFQTSINVKSLSLSGAH